MRWLLSLITLVGAPALAAPKVGAFFEATEALNSGLELGNGGGVRVGMEANLLLFKVTPEVGVGVYESLVAPHVGASLSVGRLISPGVYGHVWVPTGGALSRGHDYGIVLEFSGVPKLDFGVHGGLVNLQIGEQRTAHVVAGAQLRFSF